MLDAYSLLFLLPVVGGKCCFAALIVAVCYKLRQVLPSSEDALVLRDHSKSRGGGPCRGGTQGREEEAGEKNLFPPSCPFLQTCSEAEEPFLEDMVMVLSPVFLAFMLYLGLIPQTLAQNDRYKEFLRKHYDPKPKGHDDSYCDTMMKRRNMTKPCKDTNTFVHGNSDDIRAVCDDRNGEPYRDGISKAVMALQRTQAFLLLLLLTLLGLGLVQPSYGQDRMYQRFLRQHVDPDTTGGNDGYCNLMMQRRKMTSHQCKRFNTFIHEDLWNIRSICSTTNIQCKNGQMNCHEGVVKVTDCRETGSSRAPNCRYRAKASTRRVVIACEGNPEVPVHFDK
ncbi:hypothetical protein R6Z07F_008297 [Ovis aries]